MSFVGISPTDIVNGAKVIRKASTAFSRGDKGARLQYQSADTALAARLDAVEQLSSRLDPASPAAEVYDDLAERERRCRAFLQRYRAALGGQGQPSSGLKQKLQYAFHGSSEVQSHVQGLQPIVDAAILHTLRLQNEEAEKHFKLVIKSMSANTSSMLQRLDTVISAFVGNPLTVLTQSPEQYSDRVLHEPAPRRDEIQANIVPLVEKADREVQSSNLTMLAHFHSLSAKILHISSQLDAMGGNTARMPHSTDADIHTYKIPQTGLCTSHEPEQLEVRLPSQGFKCSNCQDCPAFPSTRCRLAQPTVLDLCQRTKERIVGVTSVLMIATICETPMGKRTVSYLAVLYQRDFMVFAALIMMATTMVKCCASIPAQVSLLSDQSLELQTALGEELRIPPYYWESYEIFHGFMSMQFKHKPGAEHVKFGMYDIMCFENGQILAPRGWKASLSNLVRRGIKVHMSLVIQGYIKSCPHCDEPLSLRRDGTSEEHVFDGVSLGDLSSSPIALDATGSSTKRRGQALQQGQGKRDSSASQQRSALQRLADDYERFRNIASISFYVEK